MILESKILVIALSKCSLLIKSFYKNGNNTALKNNTDLKEIRTVMAWVNSLKRWLKKLKLQENLEWFFESGDKKGWNLKLLNK